MLRLAEQGRLSPDDPLGPLLSPLERELLAGDGFDLDEHSGDPRYAEAITADPQHVWTREEQVRRCVEWCDPIGAPGERYKYSDTGYVLLGLRSTWWELDDPAGAGPRAHQYIGASDTRDWHPSLDLAVAGCVLDHDATNGRALAGNLARAAADAFGEQRPAAVNSSAAR